VSTGLPQARIRTTKSSDHTLGAGRVVALVLAIARWLPLCHDHTEKALAGVVCDPIPVENDAASGWWDRGSCQSSWVAW
jgi:hypothetical protein